MIDFKTIAKQHGPTAGIAAAVAVVAVLVTRPHSPAAPSAPVIKADVDTAPPLRRCTGVDGTETAGTISVHEHGIDGCFVAFHKPFDHVPRCSVDVMGSIDSDHHFAQVGFRDVTTTKDRMTLPSAKERMLLRYTCK